MRERRESEGRKKNRLVPPEKQPGDEDTNETPKWCMILGDLPGREVACELIQPV